MVKGKKRGALSTQEMQYIDQNCFDLSVDEICAALNRNPPPIHKYIEKQNLKARDLTDHEHLLATLRSRFYFKTVQEQVSDAETEFFEHHWIDFFLQFNQDVTHSEEMQIVEVIRTEILINRSMVDRFGINERIEELEGLVNSEMMRDREEQDMQAIASFQTQIGALIGSKASYINEHEKLLSKKERYLKDLKGTRDQRKKVTDDAKTNFSMWMKQLDSMAMKEREGFDMEVQRIAGDKARERLAKLHEYQDGEVDQPLINSDTVIEETE